MKRTNITVLVSGDGSNLQALIDAIKNRVIRKADIGLVISDSPDAYALELARHENIPTIVIDEWAYPDEDQRTDELLLRLNRAGSDLIVLAGYLNILPARIVRKYRRRIINVHPSLIPKYCGRGFYGDKVHEAVLASGDAESGATVHYVDEGVETGKIVLQTRVNVLPEDTVKTLSIRVLEMERVILVKSVANIIGRIRGGVRRAAIFGSLIAILVAALGVLACIQFGLINLY